MANSVDTYTYPPYEQSSPKDVKPSWLDGQVDLSLIPEDSWFEPLDRLREDDMRSEHPLSGRSTALMVLAMWRSWDSADKDGPLYDPFAETTPSSEENSPTNTEYFYNQDTDNGRPNRHVNRPELMGADVETELF